MLSNIRTVGCAASLWYSARRSPRTRCCIAPPPGGEAAINTYLKVPSSILAGGKSGARKSFCSSVLLEEGSLPPDLMAAASARSSAVVVAPASPVYAARATNMPSNSLLSPLGDPRDGGHFGGKLAIRVLASRDLREDACRVCGVSRAVNATRRNSNL